MRACIYRDSCGEADWYCDQCEYYDGGNYEQQAVREYWQCLREASEEYYEMIKEYNDTNDEW